MTRLWIPPQFRRPTARLHPYLKECVRDLKKHGFCVVAGDLIIDKHIASGVQMEMFREACRSVSNETGQNLLVDPHALERPGDWPWKGKAGDLLVALLPPGMEGTLPDEKGVPLDADGKGVLTTGEKKGMVITEDGIERPVDEPKPLIV